MKFFYYSIISSGFAGAKRNDPNDYVFTVYVLMSIPLSGYIISINNILEMLDICKILYVFEVRFNNKLSLSSGRFSLFLNYGIISFIINYFIFYFRDNYKNILKNYNEKPGKLMIIYILGSFLFMGFITFLHRWLYVKGVLELTDKMSPLFIINL